MKKYKFDTRYISAGITALLVIFCCIAFYMLFQRWDVLSAAIGKFMNILSPFVWGAVIAYLLNPMMKFFQHNFFAPFAEQIAKKERTRFFIARVFSVAVSLVVASAIVSALVWLIVPRFYDSIVSIIYSIPEYIKQSNDYLVRILEDYPEVNAVVQNFINDIYTDITSWMTNMQPQMKNILDTISNSVLSIIGMFFDIFIGVIVSCYLLCGKEKFAAQIKRIMYSAMPLEKAENCMKGIAYVDKVFMGFLGGKLVDSAIIGVLCYIGCVILKMPYAVLIAVIVGVTNIIPYFGPFIGAIPSAFFILMVDPFKCLIFVIFIIALQQFDGNILGPHILGNSVGISGFWVMFSIIVGSGLFGFMGMLLGVPVFVILGTAINILVENGLKKRGLPKETAEYACLDHMDPVTHVAVHKEDDDIPMSVYEEIIEEQ